MTLVTNTPLLEALGPIPITPISRSIMNSEMVRIVDVPSLGGMFAGGEILPSNPIGKPAWTAEICAAFGKTFTEMAWAQAHPFTLYRGVKCKSVGYDEERAMADLEKTYLDSEGWAIQQMMGELLAPYQLDLIKLGTSATAGTRFATLMDYVRSRYPGLVIILMSAADMTALGPSQMVYVNDTGAWTLWGDPIGVGTGTAFTVAGYPGDAHHVRRRAVHPAARAARSAPGPEHEHQRSSHADRAVLRHRCRQQLHRRRLGWDLTMTYALSEDEVYVYGQTYENARFLLNAAEENEFAPEVVRSGDSGFYIPRELAELAFGETPASDDAPEVPSA